MRRCAEDPMKVCAGLKSLSKCWNASFFSHIYFFFISAPALNVWAYNWRKANIVLKQTHNSSCLSKCSVSHTGICFLSKLGPHCFQIVCSSHNNLHEKYVCVGNDDQDPSGDDRRDRIMTLWGANVLQQSLRVTGMGLCCTSLGLACCSTQQLSQKDKALWKGASQGSA